MNIRRKTRLSLLVLAAILCRLDFYSAWQTLTESENAVMIGSSLLLGVLVVLLSTLIAAPLAYLFSRTCFARYRAFNIIFMIPFMTPPYIASMGWILFMQKRGLLQQLFPAAAGCENWFFSLGGLVLVMSLHVFPFMLTMLKNAMLNIPSSLEESGAVFGAGFWQRMRKSSCRCSAEIMPSARCWCLSRPFRNTARPPLSESASALRCSPRKSTAMLP